MHSNPMATSSGGSSTSSVLASSSGLDSDSDSETVASNTSSSTVSILDRLKVPRQSGNGRLLLILHHLVKSARVRVR